MSEYTLFQDIEKYDTIIIHRHSRPDLDALGSQLGLMEALKYRYPSKKIYAVGDGSSKYGFIGTMDTIPDETYRSTLVIIVDVAVSYMISDERYKIADKVWVIHHHKNQCDVTENWLCDSTRSAAAEYITDLLKKHDFLIPPHAATCLLGGIITDSGRFMYGDDMAETLRIAADLVEAGADSKYIFDHIYVESLEDREMKNYFSKRVKIQDGVAWLENGPQVFKKFPREFNDISRGMLSLMSGITEIEIWCNFTYDKESKTVKCEFRSRSIEIVDVAKSLGGGGHALACGATIQSFEEVPAIINTFADLIRKQK